MVNLQIDSDAKKYIKDKNIDEITVKLERYGGGWAGFTYKPAVVVGKPADTTNYTIHQEDGIKVYISPFIEAKNGLKIYLGGLSLFKSLKVKPIS